MTTFETFELPAFLNESLQAMNIITPTLIQQQAIPGGLEGRDILGSSQTGTGKTIAYLIPVIANVINSGQAKALILAPTRELAAQIHDMAHKLHGNNISVALLIGGEPIAKQFSQLRRHPTLIIVTPGRINDHLIRKTLCLKDVRFLVLD